MCNFQLCLQQVFLFLQSIFLMFDVQQILCEGTKHDCVANKCPRLLFCGDTLVREIFETSWVTCLSPACTRSKSMEHKSIILKKNSLLHPWFAFEFLGLEPRALSTARGAGLITAGAACAFAIYDIQLQYYLSQHLQEYYLSHLQETKINDK